MSATLFDQVEFIWAVVVSIDLAIYISVGMIALPLLLNRKFSPQLEARGFVWPFYASDSLPYYFSARAGQYAWAILFEWYSQKAFQLPRSFFRSQVSRSIVVLCWVLFVAEWVGYVVVLPVGIYGLVSRWFH